MKPTLVLLGALFLATAPAHANPELAKQKLCTGCHAVDKKQIGPAFKDIAARYAGQKDVAPRLADKIVQGGAGVWGAVPMPANPKVTPDEARALANWILTVK